MSQDPCCPHLGTMAGQDTVAAFKPACCTNAVFKIFKAQETPPSAVVQL